MHISVDIIVVIALVAAIFGLFFYFGKSLLLAALLSLYTSTVLFSLFPYTGTIVNAVGSNSLKTFIAPAIFLVFWILSFLIFKNTISDDFSSGFVSKAFTGIVVALLLGGTLLAVLYNILSFSQFYAFAEPVKSVFVFANALFWWFLGGMIACFFLLRR